MESFRTEIEDRLSKDIIDLEKIHLFKKVRLMRSVFAAFAWHVAFMVSVRKVFK
jgi:hypothetical protein